MRRFIPTILLVVICIGGFWFASSKDFFREKEAETQPFLTAAEEDVQGVSVLTMEQQVELALRDGKWEMTQPSAAPVSPLRVESWIRSLGLVKQEKVIEENAQDLTKYGLDKPLQDYKVTLKDGTVKGFQVGMPLPIQGYSYAKADDSRTVYQVSDQALELLKRTAVDFMEANPIRFDNDQVQQVKLSWKGQSWALSKSDKDKVAAEAAWKLGDKELKGADASPLLDQLTWLSTGLLTKPAQEVPTAGGELRVEVTVSANGAETTDVYEGKLDAAKVWLAKQGGEWVYQLTEEDVQKVADSYAEKAK